jgi:hypothetical protein
MGRGATLALRLYDGVLRRALGWRNVDSAFVEVVVVRGDGGRS